MSELLLYQKSYDFLLWVFNKTDGFQKSKRFSIGRRLEELMLDFIVLIHRYRYTKKERKSAFALSLKFDEIKLLLKICYDSRLFGSNAFAFSVKSCEEIGAMIGGLIRSSAKDREKRC